MNKQFNSNLITLYNENNEIIFTQNELNKLGNLIKRTVLNVIPPFRSLKEYFDDIIKILSYLNEPIY